VIRLDNISKQHGPQILFVEASAALLRGEKVGLVGPNGAGKSTIFRLIMGEESPDEGQISIDRNVTIGHFSQDVGEMKGMSAVAATMDGAGPVSELATELHELEHAMADPARADELDASWWIASATCRRASTSWAATPWRRGRARSWPAWAFRKR
jgi:ATPase subunit of ABC transporter with duplicated ATPase domains